MHASEAQPGALPNEAARATAAAAPGEHASARAPGLSRDPTTGGPQEARFDWDETQPGTLVLRDKGLPVLAYNHAPRGPGGSPGRTLRGSYLHPLWSLDGKTVLTDDFPEDHLHHRGLFWAWPSVIVDGVRHDSWQFDHAPIENRHVRWLERTHDENGARLGVENVWVASGREVLREQVLVFVRQRTAEGRAITLELRLTALQLPVTLAGAEGKGYGGVSLRLAVGAEAEPRIHTQLGSEKKDLLETALHWADFTARFPGQAQRQGVLLSTAAGHSAPPPLWMTRHYGMLMACWPGTRPLTLEPGKTVVLRYQVLVHEEADEPGAPAEGAPAGK